MPFNVTSLPPSIILQTSACSLERIIDSSSKILMGRIHLCMLTNSGSFNRRAAPLGLALASPRFPPAEPSSQSECDTRPSL